MKPASFDTAEWIDAWRDRRPMTDDEVLVTYAKGADMVVGIGRYINHWILTNQLVLCTNGFPVLAWMPLPEAYDPVEAAEKLPSGIFIDGESVRLIK